jgi:hypothetical protein
LHGDRQWGSQQPLDLMRGSLQDWLTSATSQHSPNPRRGEVEGLLGPTWDGSTAAGKYQTTESAAAIHTLSDPWIAASVEAWFRGQSTDTSATEETGDPFPRMDAADFLAFGKDATALPEFELLDLLDLFDRSSVGSIGFDEFLMVVTLLAAAEARAVPNFINSHVKALYQMLSRPGSGGPTTTSIIQLCAAVGLSNQLVEPKLEAGQLEMHRVVSEESDFARLLFNCCTELEPKNHTDQALATGLTMAASEETGRPAGNSCGDCGCAVS